MPALLVWQLYLSFYICGIFASWRPLPVGIPLFLLIVSTRKRLPLKFLLAGLAIFILSFAWHHVKINDLIAQIEAPPAWLDTPKARFSGLVHSVQPLPDNRARIYLCHVRNIDQADELPGFCVWNWSAPQDLPFPGQTVELTRPIQPNITFSNESVSSYQLYLLANELLWRVWSRDGQGDPVVSGIPNALAELRDKIKQRFYDILNDNSDKKIPLTQSKAILMALIFGDRSSLSSNTITLFASATLAHSLALSGQHLGLVLLIAASIAWAAGGAYPRLFLGIPKILFTLLCSIPLALLYLWIGNAPPSLVRAACMLMIAALFLIRRRPFHGFDVLALALLLILAFKPFAIFDIGLQLSVICVAIIILSWPIISRAIQLPHSCSYIQRLGIWLIKIILISLIIQLVLLPLNLLKFHNIGLWFPLNALWLPILGFVTLPFSGAALCLCTLPWQATMQMGQMCASIAAEPCKWMLEILTYLASAGWYQTPPFIYPHWSVLIVYPMILICASVAFNKPLLSYKIIKPFIVLTLLLLAVGPILRLFNIANQKITLEAFDVGQGQAIALALPNGIRILVDGGGSQSEHFDPGAMILAPIMADNHMPDISAVINSHPDIDHLGGLIYILNHLPVTSVFYNGTSPTGYLADSWRSITSKISLISLREGDRIYLGGHNSDIWLDVLWPPQNLDQESNQASSNARSLVLRLVKDRKGLAIIPGDADKAIFQQLLKENRSLKSLIIFVPHHGSDKNLLPKFYQEADPRLAIVNCGYKNRYHFPGKKLRALLRKLNVPLLDTGNHGRIVIQIEDESIKWKTNKSEGNRLNQALSGLIPIDP